MALETKYDRIVRTGDTSNLLSSVLPTLPNLNKPKTNNTTVNNTVTPAEQVAKIAGFININPMYLKNTTNSLSINSFADALLNREASNRKWVDTSLQGVSWLQPLANSIMLIKEGTIDPVVGSIQLANQNKNDNFGWWDGLSTGVNTALLNGLVNIGNTLDILANPIKGLVLDGEHGGFIKGLVGDEHGRKQYDYTDYGMPFVPALLAEFASDPVNWVSFGVGGAIKGAAGLAGKTTAKAALEATQEVVENVVKRGVKEITEEVVEEATEAVAKKAAKEVVEEVTEEAAEAATKTITRYTLDNGEDAVQYFTKAMSDKGVEVSQESVEKLLRGLMKNNDDAAKAAAKTVVREVDDAAKEELFEGIKKYMKNIGNYMSRGNVDFTDESLQKYLLKSVMEMRKPGREALDVSSLIRNYAFDIAPKTVDELPSWVKTVHGLNKFDNVMTDILRWPAIVTSPIIGGGIGAWKGAGAGLKKLSAIRFAKNYAKELTNAEKFVGLTDYKLDFNNGKVVEEAPIKVNSIFTKTELTTEINETVNNTIDKSLTKFEYSLYEADAFEPNIFVAHQKEALNEVLDVIKEQTGLDSFDDYIKSVKNLYALNTNNHTISEYIKKLELIKRYLTVDPSDELTMATLFDAIRKRVSSSIKLYRDLRKNGTTVQEELYNRVQKIVAANNRKSKTNAALGTAEEYENQLKFAQSLLDEEDYFVTLRNNIENAKRFDLDNTSEKAFERTGKYIQPDTASNIEIELADKYKAFFDLLDEFSEDSSNEALAASLITTYKELETDLIIMRKGLEAAEAESGKIQGLDTRFIGEEWLNTKNPNVGKVFPEFVEDTASETNSIISALIELRQIKHKIIKAIEPSTDDIPLTFKELEQLYKTYADKLSLFKKQIKHISNEKTHRQLLEYTDTLTTATTLKELSLNKDVVDGLYKTIPTVERTKLNVFFENETAVKNYLKQRLEGSGLDYPILPNFEKAYAVESQDLARHTFKTTGKPMAVDVIRYTVADKHPETVLLNLLKRLPESPEAVYDSLESITELVEHGVVAYTLMRSKANVLDDILANDAAFAALLKEYKTKGTPLYKVFNDPTTKDLTEVVAARELLVRLDTYKNLRNRVKSTLNQYTATLGGGKSNTIKTYFVQGILDNLVTQLERGYAFNPNALQKTIERMVEGAYRYMDSRLDIPSSAMDSILNKLKPEFKARGIELNLKGAHDANTDIDHWFKLATLDCEDNPVYGAYTKQTKGKFKIIFDTETTSTALENGEVYQLAIKLVDPDNNVVNNFFYHIKVSGNSEPSRSFLQRIGKDVNWFRNTYVNNTTLPNINDAFTDFINKAGAHCDITQAVWCGQNIKAFDMPLLTNLLKGTEHTQLLKKAKIFDSLDVMTLEKTWRLTALEESHLKKLLVDILSEDKYDVLTSITRRRRLFEYSDLVTLRNLNKTMYGNVDEMNQTIQDVLNKTTVKAATQNTKIQTTVKNINKFFGYSEALPKDVDCFDVFIKNKKYREAVKHITKRLTTILNRQPASLDTGVRQLYETTIASLKTLSSVYKTTRGLDVTKAPELLVEFNKAYSTAHKSIKTLADIPDVGELFNTTAPGISDVSSTLIEDITGLAAKGIHSTGRTIGDALTPLEAAIQHANNVWGTYRAKITVSSDYFRMAPGQYDALTIKNLIEQGIINLDNSKNIMQYLQGHLTTNGRVWLQPRKVMSYQLSDYFDINKVKTLNGGDEQAVSFLNRLTKQAAQANKVKEWFSKEVLKLRANDIELLFEALKNVMPNYKFLYDDLSLLDKAAIVQSNLYRLHFDTTPDSNSIKAALKEFYNSPTVSKTKHKSDAELTELANKIIEQQPILAAAKARMADLTETYNELSVNSFRNNLEYAHRIELPDPDDAIFTEGAGGPELLAHNLKVTKDNILAQDRARYDKAHIYSAREAMVASALDGPIKIASDADAYLKACDDAGKVAFAKALKAEDRALTEAATRSILTGSVDDFIAHSKYSAGFKLFGTSSPVDLSKFEADRRFFVATREITDANGNTIYLNFIAVDTDTFKKAWVGTTVDEFYESGARYIPIEDTDKAVSDILKNTCAAKDATLRYVGYSTGSMLTELKLEKAFEMFVPNNLRNKFGNIEFLKHLPDLTDLTDSTKTVDYFNIPRADNAIIGGFYTHQYFDNFYCTDPINRVGKSAKAVVTNYIDNVTLGIRYLCNEHNGLATGDAWSMLNDADVYEVIKKAKGDYVCVIVEPAKTGFGKTLSGVRVRQFPIASASDVAIARKYNAHMIPVEFMYDLSKALNNYDLPKWMQVMQQISALYKIGYLGSVGWPIRNIIDSAYKNHIDDMANNTSIPRALSDTFEGVNVAMKHNNLLVQVNKAVFRNIDNSSNVIRNLSDYKVLYHYITDTPEQFQKYLGGSLDGLEKLSSADAWARQLDYNNKAHRRAVAEQLKKLDARDIAIIKDNLLEPEMFDLIHNFIKNGPSAGLSRKLQEQLYGSAETKHLLDFITKRTGVKYIFDANTTIEQGARFSMYLKRLRQGNSLNQAARAVIDTHFDYADKSLAMIYAETLFPFMSFSFKNLTYWTDQLMNTPYLSRELENILRPLLSYNSLWEPNQEAYENYDYSFDFQDDIIGFGPSAPWQMINASRLYHLLAGNIVWDSGKDVQHDAGYGETTNDLYNVFKLSPSFMDAISMLVTPISTFQERLLPPYELLGSLAIKALNGDETALQDINVSALINSLPVFGAHASRWGVSSDDKVLGLKHNNILQRMKDAGIHQGVSSLFTAVYAPHKKYNTWYGDDYEYLTTLPQYNKTYPTKGGFNFNPYGSRAYTNPYMSRVPNYRYNKAARRTPNKDLYTKSIKYNVNTTYSDLFHNRLYDNVLKKRVLDKHHYY